MRTGLTVEQLFVRRRAGRISFLAVLEAPSGARRREEVPTPFSAPEQALGYLARHFAARGDVDGASRVRVREERGGDQVDRRDLAQAFRARLTAELDRDA
jgi:hypothetical protein